MLLLSFALCLAMSVLGGLITAIILAINSSLSGLRGDLTAWLSGSMFQQDYPVLLVEITSRIPINIIDRLIAAFGWYGVAVVVRKRTQR